MTEMTTSLGGDKVAKPGKTKLFHCLYRVYGAGLTFLKRERKIPTIRASS